MKKIRIKFTDGDSVNFDYLLDSYPTLLEIDELLKFVIDKCSGLDLSVTFSFV